MQIKKLRIFYMINILIQFVMFAQIRTDVSFLLNEGDSSYVYSSGTVKNANYVLKVAKSTDRNDIFLNEARIYKMLNHYNIPKLYDYGYKENGCLVLYIESCDSNLKDFIDRYAEQISFDFKLAICKMLIDALYYLHSKNILHNDIKMENVLVKGNKVLLSDFGCSTIKGDKFVRRYENESSFKEYWAPEVRDANKVSFASDIYSLGKLMKKIFDFKNIVYLGPERDENVIQMDSIFDSMMDHFPANRITLVEVMRLEIFTVFYSFAFCFCKQKDIYFECIDGIFIKKGKTLRKTFLNSQITIFCSCDSEKHSKAATKSGFLSIFKSKNIRRKAKILDKKNTTVCINGIRNPIYLLSIDKLRDIENIFYRFKKKWNIKRN